MAQVNTDADGGFAFHVLKEWEWSCFGEAPLPRTEVFSCNAGGGAAYIGDSHGWPQEEIVLRLGDGSERCVER
jgi:hypothetical protein